MLALRYVYVLSLAIWLGGAIVMTVLAQDVLAVPTGRFQYIAYVCGALLMLTLALMAILGPRPAAFAIRLILAAAMLGAASARLMMGTIAGGLVLLYWEAREHAR
jgi:hypothetical protein